MASGYVLDSETKEPLAYATLGEIGGANGSITNEDGFFNFFVDSGSVVQVRFLGYEPKEVSAELFNGKRVTILLSPKAKRLKTVAIAAEDERVFGWIDLAKKQLKKSGYHRSKAFFELFTTKDSIPTEVLEGYYNADLRNGSIESLRYKSGRVGIAPVEESYFLSLSTSKVIQQQSILRGEAFPNQVFRMSRAQMKEAYNFSWTESDDGERTVYFQANSAYERTHFSGFFNLNSDQKITNLELSISEPAITPFIPLIRTDSLRPLELSQKWFFQTVDRDQVPYIVQFEFDYISGVPLGQPLNAASYNYYLERRIKSDCVIYLFDIDNRFNLPIFDYEVYLNDYQKIQNTPFHKAVWENERPFSESNRYKRNQEFLEKNGTIRNFSRDTGNPLDENRKHIFDHVNILWSDTNRLRFDQELDTAMAPVVNRYSLPKRSLYKLDTRLYFDVFEGQDTISHHCECVFDVYSSYYYLERDSLTNIFINLHFDLCESERLKLEARIEELEDVSAKKLLDLHQLAQKNLSRRIEVFIRETDSGSSFESLRRYNDRLLSETGVNNLEIFLPK